MIEKFKLKKFINELKSIRGRHTELVTVYIPAGYDIIKIIGHLAQEQGTASNIKDKTTRTNVVDSLERMIRHLRLFKATPVNGLAIFSGNTASQEGKQDLKVWSLEPPAPLNIRMYRCDQTFITEPLEEMLEYKETYGLIAMDNREGTVGLLKGKSISVIKDMTSAVPGKTRAGGQSSVRFARLREIAAGEFYDRIAEIANKEFLAMGKNLKGLLIGGPGMTKDTFISGAYLNNELKRKIVAVRDLSYTGDFGLKELVEKSQDALAQEEIIKEKKIMQEFFRLLATNSDKVVYGKADVEKALTLGAADKILLSEEYKEAEKIEEQAATMSTVVVYISTETEEGAQLRDLGGIAGLLRYSIEHM
ncbi:MAG: peptide chain release factor aRF-1 [Candidatus Nanoarchaeia archaeon]